MKGLLISFIAMVIRDRSPDDPNVVAIANGVIAVALTAPFFNNSSAKDSNE